MAIKVKISDSTSTTSSEIAASCTAVKSAYDLANGKAPKAHASTATTYGIGTGSNYGHVKLSDSTSSTSAASAGIAASPKAVKAAYDLANGKQDALGYTPVKTVNGTAPDTAGNVALSKADIVESLGYTPLQTAPVTSVNGQTGAVTVAGGADTEQTFTSSGTFTATKTGAHTFLLVGGGGGGAMGGGDYYPAGGGAGGQIKFVHAKLTKGATVTIIVGGGGAGGASGTATGGTGGTTSISFASSTFSAYGGAGSAYSKDSTGVGAKGSCGGGNGGNGGTNGTAGYYGAGGNHYSNGGGGGGGGGSYGNGGNGGGRAGAGSAGSYGGGGGGGGNRYGNGGAGGAGLVKIWY